MEEEPRPPTPSRLIATLVAVAAACALLALAGNRIEQQGLYYDELFQATAAFAYIGQPAPMFNVAQIRGLPALNMHYSGAIKTGMYGLYLRASGARFSVASWRWVGMILAAVGLAVFCLITRRGVPVVAIALLVMLVVTDANLLLSVRHDQGPVALSLALRLVLLGLLIRRGPAGPGVGDAAAIGLLLGLMVFEKLSSVVLVLPVGAFVLICGHGSVLARLRALAIGGLVGALPLIWLNAQSLLQSRDLVSLGNVPAKVHVPNFPLRYLRLGAGGYVQNFILGRPPQWTFIVEGYALAATLAATVVAALLLWRRVEYRRVARQVLALLGVWLVIGLEMPLLPSTTMVHHWILGTPFHYAAVALLVGLLTQSRGASAAMTRPVGLVAALAVVVLAARMPSVATLERHLSEGAASEAFDPSLTRLGELAANEPSDVLFVATTWGVATQIVCLSNGQPDRVVEAFWRYGPDDRLPRLLDQYPGKRVFYLVAMNRATDAPGHRQDIDMDFATSRAVAEEPVPAPLSALQSVTLRRYLRR